MLMMATVVAVNARAQCGASDGPMTSNTATALLMMQIEISYAGGVLDSNPQRGASVANGPGSHSASYFRTSTMFVTSVAGLPAGA